MTKPIVDILTDQMNTVAVPETRDQSLFYVSAASATLTNIFGEQETHGTCLRQSAYRMRGEEPDFPDVRSRQATYGDLISEHEAELAKRAGIYLGHETRMFTIRHGCRISGRVDLLVKIRTDAGSEEKVGVEFKSVGSYHAAKGTIKVTAGVKFFPKIQHALQAACYLDYFKNMGFCRWEVVYIDRGSGETATHFILLTPENTISINGEDTQITMDSIYRRFATIREHVDLGTLPPRDYEAEYSRQKLDLLAARKELSQADTRLLSKGQLQKGDWQCRYCEFRKRCWKGTK
jgi:hypothetical protein